MQLELEHFGSLVHSDWALVHCSVKVPVAGRFSDPSVGFAVPVDASVRHIVASSDLDGSLDFVLGELEWRLVVDIDH